MIGWDAEIGRLLATNSRLNTKVVEILANFDALEFYRENFILVNALLGGLKGACC
jgi:hypothetical protein